MQAVLEQDLAKFVPIPTEQARVADVDERKKAYLAVRSEVFRLKQLGKIQEVAELADTRLDASLKRYTGALADLLAYQTQLPSLIAFASARQFALSSSQVAGKGGKVVTDVVDTLQAISGFAKKIVEITAVIDGIAFLTYLLALNAAVEAARAGDHGRGFAVVAGEVRSLAQRSSTAGQEIKVLIETGSRLAAVAGTTMSEIMLSVQRVTTIMGAISDTSLEQEAGIGQINGAIIDLDAVTQQNAALVEEAAASAEAMHVQANDLAKLVSYSQLADEQSDALASVAAPQRMPAQQVRVARFSTLAGIGADA